MKADKCAIAFGKNATCNHEKGLMRNSFRKKHDFMMVIMMMMKAMMMKAMVVIMMMIISTSPQVPLDYGSPDCP